jgi:DNA-directed RNA polymerase subunit RPC12/RpoP
MRRKPKPAVVPMRPVPRAYASSHARCPACGDDGAEVVGVIALRLVFRCSGCGVKFHRSQAALVDLLAR